jgi:hypothetical protein
MRVFLSLILMCLLWAGLHFYVVWRLLSIPFIAHHMSARLLIPAVILLGASYVVSRVLEHYSIDGLSHVLEIVGACWVGTFFHSGAAAARWRKSRNGLSSWRRSAKRSDCSK